jgi:glycosyltransferase involved in cell wall biosynthesis
MLEKTIKLVHIVEGFVGGLSTYICEVLPQLAKSGFDVTLICSLNRSCPDAAARIAELSKVGVKVRVIPMFREVNLLKDIASLLSILRILLNNNFDIVHTHCSKAGALGRLAAILAGKKIRLHSPHCFAFLRCTSRLKKIIYLALERILGKITTKLVAVSPSEAQIAACSHIVPHHKCVVVQNGLPVKKISPDNCINRKNPIYKASLGLDENSQVVTTACRLIDYKGIFRFLKAAQLSKTDNAIFLIAGDGELKISIENFIIENNLSKKVKLLGYVQNMERIYTVSDIVVLCSDAEAQPYLLLEAMLHKCPIIATSVAGNSELISDNRGILVKPVPESIAAAVDQLLADRETGNKYAESAYNYFCNHHTIEKQISGLTQLYKSCVCKSQKSYAAGTN